MIVEVCANGLDSALRAQEAGADRIELCAELSVGGITPSQGCLKQVLQEVDLPVHVLLRPRSGPFVYNAAEWRQMESELHAILDAGAHGIVWGGLTLEHQIDLKGLERIIRLMEQGTQPLSFTFHRAIDWVVNPVEAAAELTEYPVDTILSSGGALSVESGFETLCRMKEIFTSGVVMPGGGVKASNSVAFKTAGFQAIHLSGTAFEDRGIPVAKRIFPQFNSGDLVAEFQVRVTNRESLRPVIEIVK
ncbi:copper homeostasis protein CutC [Aureicoccus marinus]|uniref:PF03932 family protein CutC n=1 Tax=Aureicoccus marinus TaxID=754435 RepID=A0A2S7TA60_9FLAO|nr:copper homeostasis protein CutC [Aureicoccus marinus]PQJ16830.1 hypothetical protein BST99_09100 [Aureicoccus marinus]